MNNEIKNLIKEIKGLELELTLRYDRAGRLYESDLTKIVCEDLYKEAESFNLDKDSFLDELEQHKELMLLELSSPEIEGSIQ